jgi:nucleoside-diphosphate-sugar epimerase
VTKEDVLHSDEKWVTYAASKKYAELAVWGWAEAHPDVDVTTSKSIILFFPLNLSHKSLFIVLPPYMYGPFSHKFLPLPKPEYETLSTTLMIYNLLFPTGVYLSLPDYADFRDVARAHVGALNNKPNRNDRKRIVIASPYGLTLKRVLDIIKKGHPELEHRFITAPAPELPYDRLDVEFERIKEITEMRKEDFHTLEEVCCI